MNQTILFWPVLTSLTELITSKISMQELQAYVVLRGSLLTAEDKKRVILESEATKSGTLDMEKVTTSVRMLGSGFFHDFTGVKKSKGKVYDAHALVTEEWEDPGAQKRPLIQKIGTKMRW